MGKLIYATDEWVSCEIPTRIDEDATHIVIDTSDVALLFSTISFFMPMRLESTLICHMKQDRLDNDVARKFPKALNVVNNQGTYSYQQRDLIVLGGADRAWGKPLAPTLVLSLNGVVGVGWGGGANGRLRNS